jgi:hypothetical protein
LVFLRTISPFLHGALHAAPWSFFSNSETGGLTMSNERQQSGSSSHSPQPIRGDEGATLIGPTNPAREAQSPSRLAPPETDHDTLPSLKWSFADSHNRLQPGGWARQTTVRELPIATELAGVNMRLKAGAIREMIGPMTAPASQPMPLSPAGCSGNYVSEVFQMITNSVNPNPEWRQLFTSA